MRVLYYTLHQHEYGEMDPINFSNYARDTLSDYIKCFDIFEEKKNTVHLGGLI